MSKLICSLAGEGRGHAARARTIVEDLCRAHEITLLASGQAYEFLSQLYLGSRRVRVESIPGLRFHYHRMRVDYSRSVLKSLPFLIKLPLYVSRVTAIIRRRQPDLAISDFEPLLPRAAKRMGLPLISCDHQHFLATSDLSALPWLLRWQAHFLGYSVRLFCMAQRATLVSSFFSVPLKRNVRGVTQIGVLLRPEILKAVRTDKGHLLVYLRRLVPNLIESLRASGRNVRVYGLGSRPPDGAIQFCEVDETTFLNDLISCHAVISTAGNQLIGEALYLRKPVLAVPDPGNLEQAINGHFLQRVGGGMVRQYECFSVQDVRDFLDAAPQLRREIDITNLAGNHAARRMIARYLPCQHAEKVLVA